MRGARRWGVCVYMWICYQENAEVTNAVACRNGRNFVHLFSWLLYFISGNRLRVCVLTFLFQCFISIHLDVFNRNSMILDIFHPFCCCLVVRIFWLILPITSTYNCV